MLSVQHKQQLAEICHLSSSSTSSFSTSSSSKSEFSSLSDCMCSIESITYAKDEPVFKEPSSSHLLASSMIDKLNLEHQIGQKQPPYLNTLTQIETHFQKENINITSNNARNERFFRPNFRFSTNPPF